MGVAHDNLLSKSLVETFGPVSVSHATKTPSGGVRGFSAAFEGVALMYGNPSEPHRMSVLVEMGREMEPTRVKLLALAAEKAKQGALFVRTEGGYKPVTLKEGGVVLGDEIAVAPRFSF